VAVARNLGLHRLRSYGGEATLPRSGLLEQALEADGARRGICFFTSAPQLKRGPWAGDRTSEILRGPLLFRRQL